MPTPVAPPAAMMILSVHFRKVVFRSPLVHEPTEILRDRFPGSMAHPVIHHRCRLPMLEEWWRDAFLPRRPTEHLMTTGPYVHLMTAGPALFSDRQLLCPLIPMVFAVSIPNQCPHFLG